MPRAAIRHWPIWIVCGLLLALAVWARPRRIEGLATLDGRHHWLTDRGALARQFAWQPGEELSLLPPHNPPHDISHPCLADDGRTRRASRAQCRVERRSVLAWRHDRVSKLKGPFKTPCLSPSVVGSRDCLIVSGPILTAAMPDTSSKLKSFCGYRRHLCLIPLRDSLTAAKSSSGTDHSHGPFGQLIRARFLTKRKSRAA